MGVALTFVSTLAEQHVEVNKIIGNAEMHNL